MGQWASEAKSTTGVGVGTPAASHASPVPAPEATLAAESSTHMSPAGSASGILASYVGPALQKTLATLALQTDFLYYFKEVLRIQVMSFDRTACAV